MVINIKGEHGAVKHTDVTRTIFIPATEGFVEAGTRGTFGYAVVTGADNLNEPVCYFTLKVPDDFVSFVSVRAVWATSAASGNMVWMLNAYYAASGEVYDIHTEEPEPGVTATGGSTIINVQEPVTPLTLANLATGDYLGLFFGRIGSAAEDTLDAPVELLGLLFTYTAEQ